MANPVRQLFQRKPAAARVVLVDLNGNPYKASGGSGGSVEIQVEGADTADQTLANFVSGTPSSLTITNPSGGIIQFDVTSTPGGVTDVTATAPITSSGGATPNIAIPQADSVTDGYLSGVDWNTFNNKQPAGAYLTTVTVNAPLSGAGTAASHLFIPKATAAVDGYLAATDFATFNGKQPAGNYITALTGDVTATGPGSAAATIANSAVTLARIQNASANSKLVGSGSAGSGSPYSELTLGTNLSMSGTTLNAAGGSGSPGGSDTQLQYNNSSSFGGISGATSDGTSVTFSNGNIHFVLPVKLWLPAAAVADSTPTGAPVWDLGIPISATAGALGSPQRAFLNFPNSGTTWAAITLLLPSDWTSTGGIDIDLIWENVATSGDMKWFVLTAFNPVDGTTVANSGANTAQTVVTAAPGTTSFVITSTISGLTLTGSTSQQAMWLRIILKRDASDGSNTMAGDAYFYGAMLTYRRQL